MKSYCVEYTYYINLLDGNISDRYDCETEEEARAFIEGLKTSRHLIQVYLITYEKII